VQEQLVGAGVSAAAWADGGPAEAREARLLPDVDVVVRVVPAAGPTTVTGSGDVAARVRAELGVR